MPDKLFYPAEILLPENGVDYVKWGVLACDQFTSQPEYWQKADDFVGEAPSTLRIILPEVYLEEAEVKQRIEKAHKIMKKYKKEVLCKKVQGFVYVERSMDGGKIRQGLVGCVDLENYSYEAGAKAQIRPSENTVKDRIPPRLAVRRGAQLESPHILMLIDDEECSVIEPIGLKKQKEKPLYDVDLMLDGGNIKAWEVTNTDEINKIENALKALQNADKFHEKYGTAQEEPVFTMAVGDGNHSLATAKAFWEEQKQKLTKQEQTQHPARFCLVELENVQSPAIEIEPIHRVIFGINPEKAAEAFEDFLNKNKIKENKENAQSFILAYKGKTKEVHYTGLPWALAAATAEAFIAEYSRLNKDLIIDYVHGSDAVQELTKEKALGILLPPFKKSDLFRGVALGGVLPKKTFSMGHAQQKRYYMECREIMK